MTRKKQIIRIAIITLVLLTIFIGGREIYFARMITINSIQIEMNGIDLVKNSESIIIGTVEKMIGSKRYFDETGELMVDTQWQVAVIKDYKNLISGNIIINVPGGRYSLTEVIVEDAPNLIEYEKVLLYIKSSKTKGEYEIVGQFQGKYSVIADKSGLEIFVQDQTNIRKTNLELENELKN
jgi:hypothetical protein